MALFYYRTNSEIGLLGPFCRVLKLQFEAYRDFLDSFDVWFSETYRG